MTKTIYICNLCGYESAKWYGCCPGCGEWNTMNEEAIVQHSSSRSGGIIKPAVSLTLDKIENDSSVRYKTGLGEIDRIQGGEFYNGTLYLSNDCEDNGNFKNIYGVNIETGNVYIAATRDVGGDNVEAEGLTFLPFEDGSVMHVLDYNKIVGVFVHHYKVDFQEECK